MKNSGLLPDLYLYVWFWKHLHKKTFLHWIAFVFCKRSVYCICVCVSLFLGFLFLSVKLLLFCQYHTDWLLTLWVLKLGGDSLLPLFFFIIVLGNLGLPLFHINFRISLLRFTKQLPGILIDTLNLRTRWKDWYPNKIKTSHPWTWNVCSFI